MLYQISVIATPIAAPTPAPIKSNRTKPATAPMAILANGMNIKAQISAAAAASTI